MSVVALSIDVYCQKNWDSSPVYRVYVDDDLLTERTWAWPAYEIYIKENIEIDVEPGNHKIVVHNCSTAGNIIFKNLIVDGIQIPETAHHEFQEMAFVVNP